MSTAYSFGLGLLKESAEETHQDVTKFEKEIAKTLTRTDKMLDMGHVFKLVGSALSNTPFIILAPILNLVVQKMHSMSGGAAYSPQAALLVTSFAYSISSYDSVSNAWRQSSNMKDDSSTLEWMAPLFGSDSVEMYKRLMRNSVGRWAVAYDLLYMWKRLNIESFENFLDSLRDVEKQDTKAWRNTFKTVQTLLRYRFSNVEDQQQLQEIVQIEVNRTDHPSSLTDRPMNFRSKKRGPYTVQQSDLDAVKNDLEDLEAGTFPESLLNAATEAAESASQKLKNLIAGLWKAKPGLQKKMVKTQNVTEEVKQVVGLQRQAAAAAAPEPQLPGDAVGRGNTRGSDNDAGPGTTTKAVRLGLADIERTRRVSNTSLSDSGQESSDDLSDSSEDPLRKNGRARIIRRRTAMKPTSPKKSKLVAGAEKRKLASARSKTLEADKKRQTEKERLQREEDERKQVEAAQRQQAEKERLQREEDERKRVEEAQRQQIEKERLRREEDHRKRVEEAQRQQTEKKRLRREEDERKQMEAAQRQQEEKERLQRGEDERKRVEEAQREQAEKERLRREEDERKRIEADAASKAAEEQQAEKNAVVRERRLLHMQKKAVAAEKKRLLAQQREAKKKLAENQQAQKREMDAQQKAQIQKMTAQQKAEKRLISKERQ
eukprot:1652420-Rhodomonas_salina.1